MLQEINRRHFFKTIAATCVGVAAAAVVVPAALVKSIPKKMTFKEGAIFYKDRLVIGAYDASIQKNIICKTRQIGSDPLFQIKWI